MKYLIVLFASIIYVSCGTKEKSHNTIPKEDHTVVLYAFDPSNNIYRTGAAIRVVKDTFMLSVTDSSDGKVTQEKAWVTDTIYYFAHYDSVRDVKNKARFDTTGKALMEWKFPLLPKQFLIHDYNKGW